MPRPKSKPTDDAWAALLSEAIKEREVLPPGEGWRTMAEIQRQMSIGGNKSYAFVRESLKAGKLEKFDGCAYAEGVLRRRVWYRPVMK